MREPLRQTLRLAGLGRCRGWLVEIEGVLEHELVDGGALGVGWGAGGDGVFAVALGVDVETAAGSRTP